MWLRRLLPVVDQSLLSELKRDRLLLFGTLALAIISWIPLLLTPILPLCDGPINTAVASLIGDVMFGRQPAAHYYSANFAPVPYWTVYVLQLVFSRLFDPLISVKLVVALCIVLLPLGVMRLLLTLGRSPRLGLWAFMLSYDHNIYSGWLSYVFAIGLTLFAIAWLIEARSLRDGARTIPIFLLLGLSHIQAVMLAGVALVALAFTQQPIRKRLAIHAAAGSGLLITIVPWLLARAKAAGGGVPKFSFEWHTAPYKIQNFFDFSLNDSSNRGDQLASAIAFTVLSFGPLVLALARRRFGAKRFDASAVALLVVALGLYAGLWMTISGPVSHWYTYPRYATVTLLALLLVPAPDLEGRRALLLVPGVLAALYMNLHVARQFHAFSMRAKPFVEVIDRVPRGASVLTLVFDDNDKDPDLKNWPFHQFHAYIAAFRRGYEPYLWDQPNLPLRYRRANRPPVLGWARQNAFDFKTYGRAHDYLLVQGFAHSDPVPQKARAEKVSVKLVIEAGKWRLYEIDKATLPAAQ